MKPCLVLAVLPVVVATGAQGSDASRTAEVHARFVAADRNKDGAIDRNEWKAAGRRDRGFQMIDANKDGRIVEAEIQAAAARFGGH